MHYVLTVGLVTISYFHRESYDSFLLVVKALVDRNVPRVLIDHELLWFVSEGEPLVDIQGLKRAKDNGKQKGKKNGNESSRRTKGEKKMKRTRMNMD